MRFSHIIATKGRPDDLRTVLESFAACAPLDAEAIVVDGDPGRSGERVLAEVAERHPGLGFRYLTSPPGLTRQRNLGLDVAGGELVLFTDDDCRLVLGVFEALASAYVEPDVVGATGRVHLAAPERRIGSRDGRLRSLLTGGGRQGTMTSWGYRRPVIEVDRPHELEWMPGAFMSARRDVARLVRFDERLTGYGLGEDDDFSYRLARRGRVRYVPGAQVHHDDLGFRTTDPRALNRAVVVNRTYLFRKNFDTRRGRVGFALLIPVLFAHRLLNREWNAARGLLDGLGEVLRPTRSQGAPPPAGATPPRPRLDAARRARTGADESSGS